MLNSRLGLFLCNPSTPARASAHLRSQGHPFSRSYGVNLPSSLTRDLPSTLGYLPPPTCVGLRYGRPVAPPDLFSAPQARSDRLWVAPPALDHLSEQALLPHSHGLRRGAPTPRPTYLQASSGFLGFTSCTADRYRNINLLSIAYGYYALGLGPTNPTRIHLPSEPLGLRRTVLTRLFATHSGIRTSARSSGPHGSPSSPPNAPLPACRLD